MRYTIVVLTGGYGTRISSMLKGVPKIMALINGKPFVDYYIEWLRKCCGNKPDIIFSAGYRGDVLKSYLDVQSKDIKILIEDRPSGTLNAVAMALDHIEDEHIVVLNGDTVFDFDVKDLLRVYKLFEYKRTVLCLTKKGGVRAPEGYKIHGDMALYTDSDADYMSLGAFITSKRNFMRTYARIVCHSMDTKNLDQYFLASVSAYALILKPSYFIDIGTPEDLKKAQTIMPELKMRKYC